MLRSEVELSETAEHEGYRIEIAGNIRSVRPIQVGAGCETRVIASIGISSAADSFDIELEKARQAIRYGATVIIDHTLTAEAIRVQKNIARNIDVPLSVIPVYNAAAYVKDAKKDFFTTEDALSIIEQQAMVGADMVTIHASVLRDDIDAIRTSKRIIPCTSRGGTMVIENMLASGEENCYWKEFKGILEIAQKYSLTISLGAIFRPASVADNVNEDILFWKELDRNAQLVEMAMKRNVPIMVEGIGHAPIDRIPEIVKRSKRFCHNVPYRVLTVSTDSALGFDHVSSAIASATAVASGADIITAVTRSEHIGLPSVADVVEGVISAKVAAHAGDLARLKDYSIDVEMSNWRSRSGCRGAISASICPQMTREALSRHRLQEGDKKCTMCGDFCALSATDRINGKMNKHDKEVN